MNARAFAPAAGAAPIRTFTGGFCDSWTETGPAGRRIAVLGDDAAFDRAYEQALKG